MMSLKRLNGMNWLKKTNVLQATDSSNLVKKLTITQYLIKLKIKFMIMIMINILLLKNFINQDQLILPQD